MEDVLNFKNFELASQFCPRGIKISQSWPRMCSSVHLNFAVVIFQIFIFVVFSCRV